jgi:1-aminocyclopropane-1-carboxylate deaminase
MLKTGGMKEYLQNCPIQELNGFSGNTITVDILRLDLLHPVVSGNKWFKLRYYLEEAISQHKTNIATFGGAYSNHIVATAFAAKEAGLQSTGYIRGDATTAPSPTLLQAMDLGMKIIFISREDYQHKEPIIEIHNTAETYWIKEGGYGITGAKGAATILTIANTEKYSHILCATGTGTMMAGLIKAAKPRQEIIGVSVLKNHLSLEAEVRTLLDEAENEKVFSFLHGYHFGGYAKHPQSLISFMHEFWETWQIPTDIVYTSKLMFAAKDMLQKNYFGPESRLLIIHSGGLQGNRSLPPNTFAF